MSFGFITASGKNVKVSEEALKKAKDIFGNLDGDDELVENSSKLDSSKSGDATPVRPSAKRFCLSRNKFKPPAFVSPMPSGNEPSTSSTYRKLPPLSVPPLRENSALNTPKTPVRTSTPENLVSGRSYSKGLTPIKLLTPYCRNWRLCVKVTEIEGIRRFRGMEVFSFLAADEGGVEVRVTAFNDLASKTAALITAGEITVCTDQPLIASPRVCFLFVKIKNIAKYLDAEIDLIGVIREVGEIRQVSSKIGDLLRRDLEVVDDTGYSINLLLWGDRTNKFEKSATRVIAVKKAYVRDYQGTIMVTTVTFSKIVIDPDLIETRSLSSWYTANKEMQFTPVSTRCFETFEDHHWIREVRQSNGLQYFSIVALVTNINLDSAVYKGCEKCRKKLLEHDGELRCARCNVTSNDYQFFYSINLEVCDFTGSRYISIFDKCAEKLIEEPANEVAKYMKYDYDKYSLYFKRLLFRKYIFRISTRSPEVPSTTPVVINKDRQRRNEDRWLVVDFAKLPYNLYITYLNKCLNTHTATQE
ncbi:unnamed protein product [Enterobius vermicularis]|uniref:Replication protein A subunit n=1 Tax=Enterobius vermicularis TaxID=51028 RepID=A0A0N4VG71_ENTVE|nr:unnamed protein product [Enterobius vermicularis]